MKMQWIMPVLLGTAICLTGCGRHGDLTVQEDSVPVVPIETAVSGTSGSSTETNTGSKKETITTVRQTTISKAETAVLSTTQNMADGSFFETLVENNLITAGTVKAENGGYAFYDSGNHLYLRFTPDPLIPNTYLDDKSQGGRLVSIAEYEQPNDWGYYDPVIYPATSISVAGLNGIWKNADGSGESFEIYDGRSIYHGRFALTDSDGKEERGDVRLQYRYNQDGEKEFCFTFYGDNGTIYYTLDASGSIPLNDLFGYQSGELHFIRQE